MDALFVRWNSTATAPQSVSHQTSSGSTHHTGSNDFGEGNIHRRTIWTSNSREITRAGTFLTSRSTHQYNEIQVTGGNSAARAAGQTVQEGATYEQITAEGVTKNTINQSASGLSSWTIAQSTYTIQTGNLPTTGVSVVTIPPETTSSSYNTTSSFTNSKAISTTLNALTTVTTNTTYVAGTTGTSTKTDYVRTQTFTSSYDDGEGDSGTYEAYFTTYTWTITVRSNTTVTGTSIKETNTTLTVTFSSASSWQLHTVYSAIRGRAFEYTNTGTDLLGKVASAFDTGIGSWKPEAFTIPRSFSTRARSIKQSSTTENSFGFTAISRTVTLSTDSFTYQTTTTGYFTRTHTTTRWGSGSQWKYYGGGGYETSSAMEGCLPIVSYTTEWLEFSTTALTRSSSSTTLSTTYWDAPATVTVTGFVTTTTQSITMQWSGMVSSTVSTTARTTMTALSNTGATEVSTTRHIFTAELTSPGNALGVTSTAQEGVTITDTYETLKGIRYLGGDPGGLAVTWRAYAFGVRSIGTSMGQSGQVYLGVSLQGVPFASTLLGYYWWSKVHRDLSVANGNTLRMGPMSIFLSEVSRRENSYTLTDYVGNVTQGVLATTDGVLRFSQDTFSFTADATVSTSSTVQSFSSEGGTYVTSVSAVTNPTTTGKIVPVTPITQTTWRQGNNFNLPVVGGVGDISSAGVGFYVWPGVFRTTTRGTSDSDFTSVTTTYFSAPTTSTVSATEHRLVGPLPLARIIRDSTVSHDAHLVWTARNPINTITDDSRHHVYGE